MARIYIGGAGGAPSNNFIRSIRESRPDAHLIGASSLPSDLFLADVDEKYVVPYATSDAYSRVLLDVIDEARPDLLHLQNDMEVRAVARLRSEIEARGVKLFLPDLETIENCVDKEKSYEIWKTSGVRVPETLLVATEADLHEAFKRFGTRIWIRATEGGGGRGALPAEDFEFARLWIDHFDGWGEFTAAQCLTPETVTWLSIWYEGDLVVGQGRRRRSWNFGNRTLSGVTGVTGVAETFADKEVDRLAQEAIHTISDTPHGIYGVDMTYGQDGLPYVTEINIGRFFTTHYFFTKAGLNMPEIYTALALEGRRPALERRVNPLPDGLVWIRGMDVEPVLTTVPELEALEAQCETF